MKINDTNLRKRIEVNGFKFHEGQLEVLKKITKSREQEFLICAGRRWGKSRVCAYLVLRQLLIPNSLVWIVTPNYLLSEIIVDYVREWLDLLLKNNKYSFNKKPFFKIVLPNGSELVAKSSRAEAGMLGRSINLAIMDEAAKINQEIWTKYLKPTTHDRRAKTVFISTPDGLNWFYDKYNELLEKKCAFHFRSIDNPLFKKDQWQDAMDTLPLQTFQQEYEAAFMSTAGSVFSGIEDIVGNYEFKDYKEGHTYIIGADFGKVNDFTVYTVLDFYTKEVVYIDRFKEMDYNLQKERLRDLTSKFGGAMVIMDSHGVGDPIYDDLLREKINIQDYKITSQTAKKWLVEKLAIYIEQKLITIPNNEELKKELLQFQRKKTEGGVLIHSAPRNKHDDMVISLALAVWAVSSPERFSEKEIENIQYTPTRVFNEYE